MSENEKDFKKIQNMGVCFSLQKNELQPDETITDERGLCAFYNGWFADFQSKNKRQSNQSHRLRLQ